MKYRIVKTTFGKLEIGQVFACSRDYLKYNIEHLFKKKTGKKTVRWADGTYKHWNLYHYKTAKDTVYIRVRTK